MRTLVTTTLCLLTSLAPGLARGAHELGVDVGQSSTVGPTVAGDVGVPWVRVHLSWDIAEANSATNDWTALDPVVDNAIAKGTQVLAVLDHTPAWASSGDLDLLTRQNDVPTVGTYAAYVKAAVDHFKTRVTHYELWDEPNNPAFFEGTEKQYLDLILVPGATTVHAECPACVVLNGGLSSAKAATAANAHDVWLDMILKQAPGTIDVVAGHIYAGFTEDDPTIGVTSDSFLNALEMHRSTTTGGVTVSGPRSFVEVMVANGWARPFWITATGAEAAAGNSAALAAQTSYYRHVLEKAAQRRWWTNTFFVDAFDSTGGATHFGITVDAGGVTYTKKPVFDFLKLAATGVHFGGTTPECGDGIDDDEDGQVDFPSDIDCTSIAAVTEGPYTPTDFSIGSVDLAGTTSVDGGSTGSTGPPPGGAMKPIQNAGCKCSFGTTESLSSGASAFLLLLAIGAFIAIRRGRRA